MYSQYQNKCFTAQLHGKKLQKLLKQNKKKLIRQIFCKLYRKQFVMIEAYYINNSQQYCRYDSIVYCCGSWELILTCKYRETTNRMKNKCCNCTFLQTIEIFMFHATFVRFRFLMSTFLQHISYAYCETLPVFAFQFYNAVCLG